MRALYIRFSRRILRAFVMPSFLVRVFVKPPLGSFPEGGCVGMLILMRLGLAGGFDFHTIYLSSLAFSFRKCFSHAPVAG